jgi:ABC-type amino acid transport substrate-binding protein
MRFSRFDERLLDEGLDFFANPRLASLLELLGDSRSERVENLAVMLRNSSANEVDELVNILERAMARLERDQARAQARRRRG